MPIKGRLLSTMSYDKRYSYKILSPVKIRSKVAIFGENGGLNIEYFFSAPNANLSAQSHRLTYFAPEYVFTCRQ